MKILIITEVFYPEEFIINELAEQWVKKGFEVEVLTRNPSYPFGKIFKGYKNKIYQKERIDNITIHRVHTLEGYEKNVKIKVLNYFWNALLASIVALFIGRKFDKVFIYQTGPLTFSYAGKLIKLFYKVDLTIWTQDIWPDSIYAYGLSLPKLLRSWINIFVKGIYKKCDNIIVSCEGFKEKINAFVPNKEVQYIPNWSIIDFYHESDKKDSNAFIFTFAGNVGKVQNLEHVVRAFAGFIKTTNANSELHIVGDGSNLNDIKEISNDLNCDKIKYFGRKAVSEMPQIYSNSDVLIISLIDKPIFKLTVPSKFQAYLSTRKPILCVVDGEVSDIVNRYDLGYSSKPNQIEEISEAMHQFYSLSKSELIEMGKNCYKVHTSVFDKQRLIEKLTAVIDA